MYYLRNVLLVGHTVRINRAHASLVIGRVMFGEIVHQVGEIDYKTH